MENLLQIEIFNKKIHYIVKSQKYINKDIIFNSVKNVVDCLLLEIDEKILVQIVCTFNTCGVVINENMPAVITITDTKFRRQKNIYVFSIDDIEKQIIEDVKIKGYDLDKSETEIEINQFSKLILSKELVNKIIYLTQQYFWEKEMKLQSKISLQVNTKIGKEMIIENGNAKVVQTPVLNVSEWSGIKRGTVGENDFLFARDLNNFLSAVNFDTKEYFFSINVSKGFDSKEQGIIYLRRNVENFWEQLQEISLDGEKFLCISK